MISSDFNYRCQPYVILCGGFPFLLPSGLPDWFLVRRSRRRRRQQRATRSETIVTLLLSLSLTLFSKECVSPSLPPCELSGKKWKKEPNLRNSVVIHNQWQEQPQKNSAVACSVQTFFLYKWCIPFLRSPLLPQLFELRIYKVITLLLMRSIFSLCTSCITIAIEVKIFYLSN